MNPPWGAGFSIHRLVEAPSQEAKICYEKMSQFVREMGSW